MKTLERLAERHNLPRIIVIGVLVMLVTLSMSALSTVTAFRASAKASRVAVEQSHQATLIAEQSASQLKFTQDTFCGLVSGIAHFEGGAPSTAYGQNIQNGATVADTKLACTPAPKP